MFSPGRSDLDQSRPQWDEPCRHAECTPVWATTKKQTYKHLFAYREARNSHRLAFFKKKSTASLTHNLLLHVLIFMQNVRTNGYLKLLMKCLNASVLFDRGTMMLMRMLRMFRLSLFTFTRGPKGLKSSSWVKTCGPSPLNISSYAVPLSRSVRVNPEDRIKNVSQPDRCSLMWAYLDFLITFSEAEPDIYCCRTWHSSAHELCGLQWKISNIKNDNIKSTYKFFMGKIFPKPFILAQGCQFQTNFASETQVFLFREERYLL